MRMKKLFSIVALSVLALLCVPTVSYAYKIKSGDYVYLGNYDGEPIVWRAIGDIENGGIEILSDKILSLKAFDARRITSEDAYVKKSGSSRWATSALRTWLNSSAITTVTYNGNTPVNGAVTMNEYDGESGFLAGFSETERSYIKKTAHSSALNAANAEGATAGNGEHIYVREAEEAGTNASAAYAEQTEDYIYLPSADDVEYIQTNFRTFGAEYHKAFPTATAIEKSFVKYSGLRTDNAWHYWLTDAMEGMNTSLVRAVTPSSTVEFASANEGIVGVRPMCTLNTSLIGVKSGSGTKNSPYVLFNDPWIDVDGSDSVVMSGSYVTVSFYKSNIPDGSTVEIYHNGNLAETDPESEIKLRALSGVNTVEAKVIASNGGVLCSDTYSFTGMELVSADVLEIDDSFDTDRLSFYHVSNDESPYTSFTYTAEERNGENDNVLVMDSTQGVSGSLATYDSKLKANYEYALIEIEFKYSSFGNANASLMSLALNTGGSSYTWWSPLSIQNDGILNITNVDIGRTQIGYIEKNVWYNMKVIVNNVKNTVSVILSDERDENGAKILCYDLAITPDFEYVYYSNISVRGTSDSHQTLHVSTLKEGGAELAGSGGMIGNINMKADGSTVRVFVKNTTQEHLTAKLIGAVYKNDGSLKEAKVCDVDLLAKNGESYELPFDEAVAKTENVRIFLFDGVTNIRPLTLSESYSISDNQD